MKSDEGAVSVEVASEETPFIEKMDQPKTWRDTVKHYFVVLLMATGIFTDAYDLFSINLVMVILAYQYDQPSWLTSMVADSCILGTIIGQLGFGYVGDLLGRRRASIVTSVLLIFGALSSALLSWNIGAVSPPYFLVIWRLILGIGIGGEYPISASVVAERSDKMANTSRGSQVAGMFSSQGIGNLVAPIVMLLLLLIFGDLYGVVWRAALLFGAIPAILVVYPRFKMDESKHFEKVKSESQMHPTEESNKRKVSLRFILKHYGWQLIGTAGSWFIFDIVFYGNGLFSGTLIEMMGFGGKSPGVDSFIATSEYNIIIGCIALPGYWFGTLLIDFYGRKTLQLCGFIAMFVLYVAIGIGYTTLEDHAPLFIILYGLTYFASNAGPNTTTYVMPTEVFPTKIRARCHGISAASGKLGALLGGAAMKPVLDTWGVGVTLIICGAISLIGVFLTIFFVKESRDISLDDLDHEFELHLDEELDKQNAQWAQTKNIEKNDEYYDAM